LCWKERFFCHPERKHTTTPCLPERGYKYLCLPERGYKYLCHPERDNKSPRHPEREHNPLCHPEREHNPLCHPEREHNPLCHPEREHNPLCHPERKHTTTPCLPERGYRRAEGSHVIRVGVNNCSPIHQCLPVKRRFSSTFRRKARTSSGVGQPHCGLPVFRCEQIIVRPYVNVSIG